MKLIVCNQKAYLEKNEFDIFLNGIKDVDLSNVVICPSYIYMEQINSKNITLGSQDVSLYNSKNHTGEILISQLKSMNIKYIIIGHSEKNEDTYIVCEKLRNTLKEKITPILCIGEELINRKDNTYKEIISNKLTSYLKDINKDLIKNIIIAYEPIWAVSSGLIPTNKEIIETTTFIKEFIKDNYDSDIRVLYGGSVNKNNINILNEIDILDGYLIGKASTNAEELKIIINKVK